MGEHAAGSAQSGEVQYVQASDVKDGCQQITRAQLQTRGATQLFT